MVEKFHCKLLLTCFRVNTKANLRFLSLRAAGEKTWYFLKGSNTMLTAKPTKLMASGRAGETIRLEAPSLPFLVFNHA